MWAGNTKRSWLLGQAFRKSESGFAAETRGHRRGSRLVGKQCRREAEAREALREFDCAEVWRYLSLAHRCRVCEIACVDVGFRIRC